MKAILVLLGCGLLVSTSVMSLGLWQTHNRATALEVTSNQLRVELQQVSAQLASLGTERAQLQEKLETQTTVNRSLQAQMEQAAAAPAEPAKPAPVQPPQPFRVRAYLGREQLGEAWLVPSNFTQDQLTGRVAYEPVIMLDEKLRGKFTVHETNYVAQPVTETVHYNYNYTPPRSYYYPVYYPVRSTRPHRPSSPPVNPMPSRPAIPSPVGSGGKSGSPWGSVFVPP